MRASPLRGADSAVRPAEPRESATTAPAIIVERLSVARGGRSILRDLSLTIDAGRITAVVCRSGVGKTTLLFALNGLVRPESGRIVVSGVGPLQSDAGLRALRRQSATIFQEHALIDRMTAIGNVLLGLADRRHPLSLFPWPRAMRERAARALADVGLLHRATARAADMSGGERQRVGIARALVRAPRVLLGDEPFASADPVLAGELADDLRALVARADITVVLVLHQMSMVRSLADRVIGLAAGRIAFDGPVSRFDAAAERHIFTQPSHLSVISNESSKEGY